MKLFGWFYRKEIDQFAIELASTFAKSHPLESDDKLSKGKNQKKLNKAITQVKKELNQFKRNNKLSIYQKALLGKQFQKELFNLGYSEEFVKKATENIILFIG